MIIFLFLLTFEPMWAATCIVWPWTFVACELHLCCCQMLYLFRCGPEGTIDDQKWENEMLVSWFYSRNWIWLTLWQRLYWRYLSYLPVFFYFCNNYPSSLHSYDGIGSLLRIWMRLAWLTCCWKVAFNHHHNRIN